MHGEALHGERGLEVHILRRDLRQLQGHLCFKEFVTLEADEGVICLQRIYNFSLFHAIILPVLDVYGLYFTLLYHFWDEPTNRRPNPNCCFLCAYFSVSKKRNIKRSPNAIKPSGTFFLEQMQTRRLGVDVKKRTRRPRGRGRAQGGRARPYPRGCLRTLLGALWCSVGFFLSKDDLREISGQLDSLWLSFSTILKNKEKTETGTGL